MMDRMRVDFPAPFLPTNVTSSPARTSSERPCRIWASLCPEYSSRTVSRGKVCCAASHKPTVSCIADTRSEIGFNNPFVGRDCLIAALGEDAPARKNGNIGTKS
jgi:hypothetical protein